MNLGKSETLDEEMQYQLSDINYHAGNKALTALAMESANEYFTLAKELLPGNCWKRRYESTFAIYQRTAKTELMCGNYENSEKLLNEVLENAKTDMDKMACLAEQTTSLSSIGNFIAAIKTANRGLAYFGKSIPDDPAEAERKREEVMGEIESKNIDIWDTILHMPFTGERKSKIELAFYSELIPDLYMSGMVPQLYLSAVQSTQHCLAGGMDESVIYSFSIMGLYLGEKGKFEEAFKYEDLARNLCAKYPNTFGATRGMNGIVWCNMHSRSRPEEIVDYCLKSVQCGKNSGDLYNAGLSYGPLMWNLQVAGSDLSRISEYADECLAFSSKYHLYFSVRLSEAIQAGWIAPMSKNYVPVDMDEKIKTWEKDNHIAAVGTYYVHMGLVHYYFGEHEKAEDYLQGVRRYLTGLTDNVLKRQWYVFLTLNALRLHERGIKYKTEEELFSHIRPLIREVEIWAGLGPLLKPYLTFLYAEIERVTGSLREARNLYIDAIDVAERNNYTFLQAYINECLAELFITHPGPGDFIAKRGIKASLPCCSMAAIHVREAARLYKKCHAERKEITLMDAYPNCFDKLSEVSLPDGLEKAAMFSNIDVNYLTKFSLLIPAEEGEDALIHRIMNVVLESSGAQNGYLLIEEDGELIVRAESHIAGQDAVKIVKQEFEKCGDICHSIVRYVYRSRETLILENASEQGDFKDNPEVQGMKLRSVFCLPVVKRNKLIGILYLENRLADSVFTPERTDMTKLFAYQAAISLENARLLERMIKAEAELKQHRERLEEAVEERSSQLSKTRKDLLIAERLAVLGQIAGSISHEIRNPLNVIGSSAYYLKMKLDTSDAKNREHIERIEREVKNTTGIVEGILGLSGIKESQKERLDITVFLNDALDTIDVPEAVKIDRRIPSSAIFVDADKEQIFMLCYNLIKNAAQAMSGEGSLTVSAEKDEGAQQVKLSFADTGEGISKENTEKILQPLFTTKAQGIGFGLFICKLIVEQHDGNIVFDSEPDKGTVATVTLPLAGSEPEEG